MRENDEATATSLSARVLRHGQRALRRLTQTGFLLFLWLLLSGGSTFFFSCTSGDRLNHPPEAFDSALVATVNVTVSGRLRATDPDGDVLRFSIVSGPQLGSVQLVDSLSGLFIYISSTPGTDRFQFIASDGFATSNVGTVVISVNPVALSWEEIHPDAPELDLLTEQKALVPPASNDGHFLSSEGKDNLVAVQSPLNPSLWFRYGDGCSLMESRDGRATWRPIPLPSAICQNGVIAYLSISRFVPRLMYLVLDCGASGSRLVRSTDAGKNWQVVLDHPERELQRVASGPMTELGDVPVYGLFAKDPGVYRLVDSPF